MISEFEGKHVIYTKLYSDDDKKKDDAKCHKDEFCFRCPIKPMADTAGPSGYTPTQLRKAYGLHNFTQSGLGQKVGIISAYNNATKIMTDFKYYDSYFGINKPDVLTIKSFGTISDSGWALESSLDTQAIHCMAPSANILLVQAKTSSLSDLLDAVNYAVTQGCSIISMSFGTNEFSAETSYDRYFNIPGIIFIASSGDTGGVSFWPSVSPYVTSVGGTTLSLTSDGTRISEVGWKGSGGGVSKYEPVSTFQYSYGFVGKRNTPDISAVADPSSGMAVRSSSSWYKVGGTSLSAPLCAGMLAVINSVRTSNSKSNLTRLSFMNYLYTTIAKTKYSSDINDVTSGQAGQNVTKPGYDNVSGFGTPKNTSSSSGFIYDLANI